MKCQKCDKTATFHITEMINAVPEELHLCDEHAYEYLHKNDAQRSPDADERSAQGCCHGCKDCEDEREEKAANLADLTRELEESDFDCCPCCQQTFLDFRKTSRLGCANDYRVFRERLEPLLRSVHGATLHRGKRPTRFVSVDAGAMLVRLRNEMRDAIQIEDYKRAAVLRDKIKALEEQKNA